MLKYSSLLLIISFLTGCKLAVIVVEGGQVQSPAHGACEEVLPGVFGRVCIYYIEDTNYLANFDAVAYPGWEFVKWQAGDGFLCADSTNSTCTVDNTSFAGNDLAEAIVDSSKTFYLMPVFGPRLVLEAETVVVEGKKWAQPDLFFNLSWNDINEACPAGNCLDGAILNDYDMSGWTWASVGDINELFNNYVVPENHFGATPSSWVDLELSGVASDSFFADGWRSWSASFGEQVLGLTSGPLSCIDACLVEITVDALGLGGDIFATNLGIPLNVGSNEIGAFFYQ